MNHTGLRQIVSEVLDELRESTYYNKDQEYADAISI